MRPPHPEDDDRDDVDKHRENENDGDDDSGSDNHRGAVETNEGESDGAYENRDSPAFVFEAISQFNANIIACHLTTGDRRWCIVGCYLAPFANKTIRYVVAAMV